MFRPCRRRHWIVLVSPVAARFLRRHPWRKTEKPTVLRPVLMDTHSRISAVAAVNAADQATQLAWFRIQSRLR